MTGWQVRYGRGWRDQVPPDVRTVLELHDENGKQGVLCVHADAHLEGFQGSSDIMFYDTTAGVEAVAMAFKAVSQFLEKLSQPGVDVASLIWVNFELKTFALSPRPEPIRGEAGEVAEGLRVFLDSVTGSVQGPGMWSSCEWAMVSCSREADGGA